MVFMYESIINKVETGLSYTWDPTLTQVDAKSILELNEISFDLFRQLESSYSFSLNLNLSKLDRKSMHGSAWYSHSNP